jgi:hypothetical protein
VFTGQQGLLYVLGMQVIGRIDGNNIYLRIIQHILVVGGIVMKIKFLRALFAGFDIPVAYHFQFQLSLCNAADMVLRPSPNPNMPIFINVELLSY